MRETPPAALIADRPEPVLEGNKNRNLLILNAELRCVVRQSNADKAALRDWAAQRAYAPDEERNRCD